MNRFQFQAGLSLNDFLAKYGRQQQCEEALEAARWPCGFQCPGCGAKRHCSYRRDNIKVFQCSHCRKQTTLMENTIFHSSKLPLTIWFQAMFFLTQNKNNVSALELKRLLGIGYRAAWRMKHKLMQVMFEREQSTRLSERVEVDDAYLGGEHEGGKRGRGSENKVPFIAAIQTKKQNPIYAVFSPVKGFSQKEIKDWAKRSLVPSTTVVTDGLACFTAVTEAECIHERNIVGKGRKSTSMGCFTWINTILGNLKTAIMGTYHSFSFDKYPHRYLGEYQYRFNRRFDLAAMLPRLVTAAARTGRRPEAWLRLAEDWR
jgi:transposase-like protein